MACSGNTVACSCNAYNENTGTSINEYGKAGSDARATTSWSNPKDTIATASHLVQMQNAMTAELSIRSLAAGGFSTPTSKNTKILWSEINKIKTAIMNCRTKDGGAAWNIPDMSGNAINGAWIQSVRSYINTLQAVCICNCNYCTCNCNYCTCNCNYCTCNCNYCTCQCNCNCNYCTCNCNYCTCNCNYCTCNCNYSCTCNCDYSDKRLKYDIEYF